LLLVARRGPSEVTFEPVPTQDSYTLSGLLDLRERERALDKELASLSLQKEQSDRQLRLLQDRRDAITRQYQGLSPESPVRILIGINRVSARVEYQLAHATTGNLANRQQKVAEQRQRVTSQEDYARSHLEPGDVTLDQVDTALNDARGAVVAATEQVTALQTQLLDALSADRANNSLELLRKQQLTRASAETELAQINALLAEAVAAWYHFRAGQLETVYDLQTASQHARQVSDQALRQVDVWATISQASLLSSPVDNSPNAIKNHEIAQAVALETLSAGNQLRSSADDLKLVHEVLASELLGTQSGARRALSNFNLAIGSLWHRVQGFFDRHLFNIGDTPVTPGGLFKMVMILAIAFAVSWFIRYLIGRGFGGTEQLMQSPALYTLGRLLHYIIILVGVFAALGSIGIDFTSFALIAGALSVGIGFGLQAIVNNFVSGLILLFEGSLRVGDYIELDSGLAGVVREINTRATVVNTNDSVDVVVPNSELVTTKLTNWTLRESVARMRIPFGVAYGTSKELVRKVALEATGDVEFILTEMPGRHPQVRLSNLGDSALEFEALFWVSRSGVRRPHRVRCDYLWALETRLTAAGIEIPYPQRDLHIRTDSSNRPSRLAAQDAPDESKNESKTESESD
jgi:small-conductance mechanosensitive channel